MITEQMVEALKPCPFCGGPARLDEIPPHSHGSLARFMPDHPGSFTIECDPCGAGLIDDDKATVIGRWNRRAATALSQAEGAPQVERLKDFLEDAAEALDGHGSLDERERAIARALTEIKAFLALPTRPREQATEDFLDKVDFIWTGKPPGPEGGMPNQLQEFKETFRAYRSALTSEDLPKVTELLNEHFPEADLLQFIDLERDQHILHGRAWAAKACESIASYILAHPLPAASFQAGAEAMREAAAKVVTDLTKKHGHPDGTDYQMGAQDHGRRIADALQSLPIPASSEGR